MKSFALLHEKMSDDETGAGGAPQADAAASTLTPPPTAASITAGSARNAPGVNAAGVMDTAAAAAAANIYSYRGWGKDSDSTGGSARSNGGKNSGHYGGSNDSSSHQASWRDPPPPRPPAAPSYASLHASVRATAADSRTSSDASSSTANSGVASSGAAGSYEAGSNGNIAASCSGGNVTEDRLARLETLVAESDRRLGALEASAHVQRKVVCDLLMTDLAHDDRAVSAIKRVKQLLLRTFPERCDSGVIWLGNGRCDLARLAPDTLIHVMGFLKCKFGRTAMSRVAPVFWMPQPNLRQAKSVSSFVSGFGQAVVTLSGHRGAYAKFMGMYELDLRHIVHGYPLFKKMGMAKPHFIYKCSLNGKWLVTDEEDHCPKNLSRIGSTREAESPDEPGMTFEVWQDGAWVHDPKLKVAEGRASAFPKTIVFYGHTGPQHRFMGTYEMDPDRVVHGYPLYRRKPPPPTPIPPSRGSRRHRSRNGASSSSSSSNPLLENTGADSATASTTTGGQGTHSSSSSSSTSSSSSSSNGAAWAAAANDGKAVRKDYVYKCSLNGKWLLTDDDDHFAMNLSRIGTDSAVELITAPGVTFEVWRSGAWHKDLNLKVEATCDDDDDDDSRNNNNNSSHYGDYSPANADYLGTGLSRALDRGLALSTPNRSGGF